ncbi:hypothetical protein, partial [Bacteroides thetaiotaomicron]|uniref:hypothetical protein n=1 Tax=Bacteroides thetaiotaomicron TaxID=818 RepID=UPI001E31DC51
FRNRYTLIIETPFIYGTRRYLHTGKSGIRAEEALRKTGQGGGHQGHGTGAFADQKHGGGVRHDTKRFHPGKGSRI